MPRFAVIGDENIVENIVAGDNKETVESVVGKTCIEYTEENPAHIGLSWIDGVFSQPETEPVE